MILSIMELELKYKLQILETDFADRAAEGYYAKHDASNPVAQIEDARREDARREQDYPFLSRGVDLILRKYAEQGASEAVLGILKIGANDLAGIITENAEAQAALKDQPALTFVEGLTFPEE
jgi:hypothetical protein